MNIIKPPRLQPGDKIGLITPSNNIAMKQDIMRHAMKKLEKGLKIEFVLAPHALDKHFYTSTSVQNKLDDFHQMIADPDIKAIWISYSGHTAVDLVNKLDYQLIKDNPKIIAGISDGTVLLNPIFAKTGLITFLGLEFMEFGKRDMSYELDTIKKMWFDNQQATFEPNPNWHDFYDTYTRYTGWQCIRKGTATGRLIGGTMSRVLALDGTEYLPELENNILVLEGYMMHKKQVHHLLSCLRLRGVFDKISGLILGYLVGSDDPDMDGNDRDLKNLVSEVTDGYDFPIMQVGEIGHYVENIMLPIGARAHMDAEKLEFGLEERVCE